LLTDMKFSTSIKIRWKISHSFVKLFDIHHFWCTYYYFKEYQYKNFDNYYNTGTSSLLLLNQCILYKHVTLYLYWLFLSRATVGCIKINCMTFKSSVLFESLTITCVVGCAHNKSVHTSKRWGVTTTCDWPLLQGTFATTKSCQASSTRRWKHLIVNAWQRMTATVAFNKKAFFAEI